MHRSRVWPVLGRVALWSLGIVLVLALVATGLVVWSVRRAFPEHDGTLAVPGLDQPVTVLRDSYGIPQLYASSAEDLFLAQGYVHAQDRFWEMDFRRHVTAGRLSELFGVSQVPTDAFLRTLGWRRVAEQEWALLPEEVQRYLQAYADGVNAWIAANGGAEASGAKSLEYSVLGLTNGDYTVQPWTPVDSLAWLKAMAWDLRGNMESEIGRAVLLAHGLTRAEVDQLYPAYPFDRHRPIVAGGAVVNGGFDPTATPGPPESSATPNPSASPSPGAGPSAGPPGVAPAVQPDTSGDTPVWRDVAPALDALSSILAGLPNLMGDGGSGIGSNSWVLSGSLTSTGKPMLANDPHLSPSMPGIWYQMGLHCTCAVNVAGFTFAGVPGVVIGHNARIAWGFTNLDPDVTDLYLEQLDGDKVFDGTSWVDLTTREEVITVAGGAPVTITVRSTKHGPLLSDRSKDLLTMAARPAVDPSGSPVPTAAPAPTPSLDPAAEGTPPAAAGSRYGVALRWTALDPGRTAAALFRLNVASNWADLRAAAALFEVPAQNIVYADVDGNIGYQSPGRVPVRGKGDGRWPVPGWDPAYDWTGYIPFDELPTSYNPAQGWLVTANQAVVGPTYPHLLTHDWSYGYRSQRIMDLLTQRISTGKIGAEEIRQLQFDNRNGFAPTLVPALLAAAVPSGAPQQLGKARDLLRGWDFQQPADAPAGSAAAAAFYNATWRHLLERTFDELPAERRPDGGDRWWEVVGPLLNQPDSPWWDDRSTSTVEKRDDLLSAAMVDAVAELTERLDDDPAAWRWGELHTLDLRNATFGESGVAPIEWLFNRGPVGTSGGDAIVNATGWTARDGYQVDAVPSMRMIVDLADLDNSRWIQLTGNSGHAFHANYDDQVELWRTGQNLPMRWNRASIDQATVDRLSLNP
ncbi:MAG TPA: penicillin acylase family protein [Micromonosporaceae bacterium]